MNGAHDLGGLHGFGPIHAEPQTQEPVFHADWERRVFGLVRAVSPLGCWNRDMSRFARERQHPVEYLRHSYYENWLAGLEKLLVEKSLVTPEELHAGRSAQVADETLRQRTLRPAAVPDLLARGQPATLAAADPPRFKLGDRVQAINRHPLGHTREPRYVRGHVGVIHAYHGSHVLPDLNADGVSVGRHLYGVRFEAAELWGEPANAQIAVYVDLWEDYLEAAA